MITFKINDTLVIKDLPLFRKEAKLTGAWGAYVESELPTKFKRLRDEGEYATLAYLWHLDDIKDPSLVKTQVFYYSVFNSLMYADINKVPVPNLYTYLRYNDV